MNTALKLSDSSFSEVESPLQKVDTTYQNEDERLNQIYDALGWGDLPYRLKFQIAPDVVGYYDELIGMYSTCDPFVLARRKRVLYWINNYREGNCTLNTAVQALKIAS